MSLPLGRDIFTFSKGENRFIRLRTLPSAASAICVFRRWRKTQSARRRRALCGGSFAAAANKARTAASLKGNCRPRFVYYRGNLVSVIN